ncbi:MAG TPA: hypothetical protein VL096_21345 [Pirellulaceae bacterium]|nr:hypothetical protein [Pirellulaceae bacterium]
MALQIVVAHVHCLCHEEVEPLSVVRRQHRQPSVPERHCHNEFGCICKGATLIENVTPDEVSLAFEQCLPIDAQLSSLHAPTSLTPSMAGELAPPPTLSGRMLRALYASFVI